MTYRATGVKRIIPKGKGGAIRKRPTLPRALELQGLPADFFEHSPFTKDAKHKMLGNGVPMFMGRALADAVWCALYENKTEEAAA